jgi:hypothetical protein
MRQSEELTGGGPPRARRASAARVPKSYNLERAVVQLVEALAAEEERSQSTVVNRIIREYAALNGLSLPGLHAGAGGSRSE